MSRGSWVGWQTRRLKPAAVQGSQTDNWRANPEIAGGGVLVDHGRKKTAQKRGGGWSRTTLQDKLAISGKPALDVLALEEALTGLEELDGRKARIVELRVFGGLTNEEAGRVLGVSARTVEDDWYTARAWLLRELEKGEDA